ncbi:MAG: Na/Pi cotransporter family protein [Clostridia bacterium]|nr:Na/Pi cotransporter family protein [Clostridia bacterium]
MDWKDVLNLIGGLCLFLFGMNIMGDALERRAGNNLKSLLGRMTTKKSAGLLTGIGVTAVVQSSSATTVMIVGFVNSGLMTLRQAINVIMGANIGTTVTAWILSLGGLGEDSLVMQLLKPTSFSPVLALFGIIFYMFSKSKKKNDTGLIFLGFATLMYGMNTMSTSVSGLADVEAFRQLFVMFENPILGVIAGALVTAIIQSSSASVGILQALSVTGQITLGSAIPIIMGQNIGTCVTAILSSVGTNKNAKRAAAVHLLFNVIGTVTWLLIFTVAKAIFRPEILGNSIGHVEIAVCHSVFNILCTVLLLPMTGLLEKLANKLVSDADKPEQLVELDERLLATPPIALERCRVVAIDMAHAAVSAMKDSLLCLTQYTPELAERVRENEEKTDHYEDIIGTYLVKLSSNHNSEQDSAKAAEILKLISDFERISDHSVDILESVEELRDKELSFSEHGKKELAVLSAAVNEILDLSYDSFADGDTAKAGMVEPLEQIIDGLKEQMRTRHIFRLQQGKCSIETGFIWSDLLTSFERTSDHCSNIAACVIDSDAGNMSVHESLRIFKTESDEFKKRFDEYSKKYALESM